MTADIRLVLHNFEQRRVGGETEEAEQASCPALTLQQYANELQSLGKVERYLCLQTLLSKSGEDLSSLVKQFTHLVQFPLLVGWISFSFLGWSWLLDQELLRTVENRGLLPLAHFLCSLPTY